jgi:zinc/manganese transport system substrate-binding protein
MLRLLTACVLTLLVAAPALAQQKLRVVTSFSILGDIVAQVGGDRIDVVTLVPAMADAHVFQPSPSDARAVATADVLVASGLNFEPWLDRLAAASGFRGRHIVAAEGIAAIALRNDHHGHSHGHKHDHGKAGARIDDPHVWHDLTRMQTYIGNIVKGLAEADPAQAEAYRARGAAYAAELKQLDVWAEAEIGKVPQVQRKVITQHDAFGYLAARYRIAFMAPQGITTEAEASADAVGRLIRQIKREKVQALFFENIANPRLIEQIGREANVKVGGRLYSDALSPPGGEADSFVKMYRLNIARLVEAMKRD